MYLFENILGQEELPDDWHKNPETGLIDTDLSVYLENKNFSKLPYKFGIVAGSFFCNYNQLTSLEGSPQYVGGDFRCDHNQLTSLKGGPKEIRGNYWCHGNQLTTLKFVPIKIGGDFLCFNNQLRSYKFLPQCRNYNDAKREIQMMKKNYLMSLGYKQGTPAFRAALIALEKSE